MTCLIRYLNSIDSPVFSKGGTLYAYHLAKGAMRRAGRAVIVEGYMDAIALHSVGIRCAELRWSPLVGAGRRRWPPLAAADCL